MSPEVLVEPEAPGTQPKGLSRHFPQAGVDELRAKYPPRAVPRSWPESTEDAARLLERLDEPPIRADNQLTRWSRKRGARRILEWLEQFPGESWQERWMASGISEHDPKWLLGAVSGHDPDSAYVRSGDLNAGTLAILALDVVRPDLGWLVQRRSRYQRELITQTRDPEGFAQLEATVDPEMWSSQLGSAIRGQIAQILIAKGGRISDITVGDCLELRDARAQVHKTEGGLHPSMFYAWLHGLGIFPHDAPTTISRSKSYHGRRTPAELVDRYQLKSQNVRDALVAYLTERQPAMDYTSLEDQSRILANLFWADLEKHHPGIDSLALAPEVAAAWKERIRFKTEHRRQPDGTAIEVTSPRASAVDVMMKVRAFYLDIAQWAVDDPGQWSRWAARSPIGDTKAAHRKATRQQKARSDERTRSRLPGVPELVRVAGQRLKDAQARLEAVQAAPGGSTFTVLGETLTKARTSRRSNSDSSTIVRGADGRRRDLAKAEHRAFCAWAAIEFFRHTGCRIEEMLESSHHSIVQYKLPSTGEIVPLLQIAPSKTDEERVLLVSPELADVLSIVVSRVRDPKTGTIPLVAAFDTAERVWNPPMPLLFQWTLNGENRPISYATVTKAIDETLAATGLTNAAGQPLLFQPHDFRRIFVTDAILSGLPPHIAQIICGHKHISTTMGYKATYPLEAIQAHRAFIARRRALRPSEEYRTPTPDEWDSFLGHFERRKLSVGTCGRAYGTSCIHEHACIRCPMLRPELTQRPRLIEYHDNLIARLAEAEREGWLGDVEGIELSLAGAKEKLAQLDSQEARARQAVDLGMPTFRDLASRISTVVAPQEPA